MIREELGRNLKLILASEILPFAQADKIFLHRQQTREIGNR